MALCYEPRETQKICKNFHVIRRHMYTCVYVCMYVCVCVCVCVYIYTHTHTHTHTYIHTHTIHVHHVQHSVEIYY
jgi:hypothetical protein